MPTRPSAPRSTGSALSLARAAVDVLAVVFAFWLSFLVYRGLVHQGVLEGQLPRWGPYGTAAAVYAVLLGSVFGARGLYRAGPGWLNIRELEEVIRGSLIAAAFFFAVLFFAGEHGFSRLEIGLSVLSSTAAVLLTRRLAWDAVLRFDLPGRAIRRVLICGTGETGHLLMKKIVRSAHTDRVLVGFLDQGRETGETIACRVEQGDDRTFEATVLGRPADLPEVARAHAVDEVIVAVGGDDSNLLDRVFELCRDAGIEFTFVPSLVGLRIDQFHTESIGAVPVLRPQVLVRKRWYSVTKRGMDLVIGSLLAVAAAPFCLVAAVLIRMDSPGPVFFRQERVGHRGLFQMLKFRTMHVEADPYAESPTSSDDTRLTRAGRLLRRGGLDELPQLINVLRGEMSLVGPRPEMPFIVERYSDIERLRLSVKPGLTGLWQLSADRDGQIHESLEYDLYYLSHRSVLMDVVILLESAYFVLATLWPFKLRPRPVEEASSGAERSRTGSPAGTGAIRPSPHTATVSPQPKPILATRPSEARGGGYLLVALDQRRTRARDHWRRALPTAYRASARWGVKLLVADENRMEVDRLLDREVKRWGTKGFRVEFAPYESGERLRELILGSSAVLTDLPHVVECAEELEIGVVKLEGRMVVGNGDATRGGAVARQVLELLTTPGGHIQPLTGM